MIPRALSPMPRTPLAGAFVAVAILTAACATNPASGHRQLNFLSEAEEIAIGRQNDAEVRREMGVYDNPELQRYVSDVGQRLAALSHRPNLPWTFTIVDHPAVNAFALPGGFIYLTRGILPYLDDEAELAGVLGHEIGHVTARHAAQQYTRAATGNIGLAILGIFVPATQPFGSVSSTALSFAFLKYGRDAERESDRLGIDYASKGGWDPTAVPRFLQTLSRMDELNERGVPNWLSTHPDPGARVAETQPIAAKAASPEATARNRDEFLSHIEGVVVGDNPKDGIVRGNAFIHPVLRFALEFPDGWDVMNTQSQVAAREPGQPHFMFLQEVDRPRGSTIDEIAARSMTNAHFREVNGETANLGGLDAHIGLYQGSMPSVGKVMMRAAHVASGRQVYLIAGFAPPEAFEKIDREIDRSVRSFRALTAREADSVHPNRLDFYTVRPGDSWQSIAARGGALVRAAELAIMNDHAVNEQPKPGDRIKIVVAG
jgi:predicted Zn-dependent protease